MPIFSPLSTPKLSLGSLAGRSVSLTGVSLGTVACSSEQLRLSSKVMSLVFIPLENWRNIQNTKFMERWLCFLSDSLPIQCKNFHHIQKRLNKIVKEIVKETLYLTNQTLSFSVYV